MPLRTTERVRCTRRCRSGCWQGRGHMRATTGRAGRPTTRQAAAGPARHISRCRGGQFFTYMDRWLATRKAAAEELH
jgi:hypothetical protein